MSLVSIEFAEVGAGDSGEILQVANGTETFVGLWDQSNPTVQLDLPIDGSALYSVIPDTPFAGDGYSLRRITVSIVPEPNGISLCIFLVSLIGSYRWVSKRKECLFGLRLAA